VAGAYSVTVTNAQGCSQSATVNLTQKPLPTATITASGAIQLAPGTSVVLSAPTEAGQTYQWLRDNQPIVGATASTFSPSQAGSYAVMVTRDGCMATSSATVISIILASEPVVAGVSLEVSPNPASDQIRVLLTLDNPAPATLRLVDANGSQIRLKRLDQPQRTHEHHFDLNTVPGGVSYLHVEVGGKQVTRKIVKN
jgi:hypothetical protein